MKKSKIYTRTGDKGETALVSGKRISKADARIELYGELDELNSRLGVVCTLTAQENKFQAIETFLLKLQSLAFDLGSNLACEPSERATYKLPQIPHPFIAELEAEIDRLEQELEPLKHFILPGGSVASAHTHLARTCARKVERMLIRFQQQSQEQLPELSVIFLNRLSDYLFVLARYLNKEQKGPERMWIPSH